MTQKNSEQTNLGAGRKNYARPELTVYGDVKKLVQAGSEKGNEAGNKGSKKRP